MQVLELTIIRFWTSFRRFRRVNKKRVLIIKKRTFNHHHLIIFNITLFKKVIFRIKKLKAGYLQKLRIVKTKK